MAEQELDLVEFAARQVAEAGTPAVVRFDAKLWRLCGLDRNNRTGMLWACRPF